MQPGIYGGWSKTWSRWDVSWNETAWYPFKNQYRRSGRGINDHASAKKCGSGGTCYDVFWTVVSVIADQTVNIG